MGIIKASVTAVRGAASDQWKEAFCAGEMGGDMLITRAQRMTGQRSANQGSSNVITDGSTIIVGEGECAVVTEGGKVIGVYDQPGEHKFRSNNSSGIFSGNVGAFFKDVGRRISFGGDVSICQRLYYINTKELTGGTICAENIPLHCKDPVTGLDMDSYVSCYGSYTFRIAKPELFYKAAIRSMNERARSDLLKQMNVEVLTALSPALAKLTQEGVRPHELPKHTEILCEKLRQVMSDKWSGLRGIEVYSAALESVRMTDTAMVSRIQRDAVLKDPTMAAGHIISATADAMRAAAVNESGSAFSAVFVKSSNNDGEWKCTCGSYNTSKFCTECGTKKPQYQCAKCGWKADTTMNAPKFCSECGEPFDKGDIK